MKKERWFEDYTPGSVYEFGSIHVSEQEIIAFASQYDPQPFHLDRALAAESVFGGLVASGWHTASMTMRLLVDYYLSEVSSLGSPGIDELRWLLPVRPGDELAVRVTILDEFLDLRNFVDTANTHILIRALVPEPDVRWYWSIATQPIIGSRPAGHVGIHRESGFPQPVVKGAPKGPHAH